MIKNGNPVFSSVDVNYEEVSADQATYKGVTVKTLFLLGVAGIAGIIAGIGLHKVQNLGALVTFLMISSVVGFISVLIGRTKVSAAKYCGVIYSVCEGVMLGTLTALLDMFYSGIALLAILATGAVFLVCLGLFACGALRNASMLRNILMIMFFSIIFLSLITLICNIFRVPGIYDLIANNFALSIGLEVIFVIYGAITLALNFHEVTYYVKLGSSKEFEWVGAFGLLVSILYIYLEALRLIALILSRKE